MSIDSTYLDFSGSQAPIEKFYDFAEGQYLVKFKYNSQGGFYTAEVFDVEGVNLIYSNKIVYGQNIFDSVLSDISGPVVPLNIVVVSGSAGDTAISQDNLGSTIKLYTGIE